MSVVINQSVSTLQYLRVTVSAIVNGAELQSHVRRCAVRLPGGDDLHAEVGAERLVHGLVGNRRVGRSGQLRGQVPRRSRWDIRPDGATDYWVWIKITDSPEIPVLFVGELQVT